MIDGLTASLTILVCPYTSLGPNDCEPGYVYKTGIEVGAAAVPTIDPGSVTISSTGGTLITVYVDGAVLPVAVPPFCVSATTPCP